MNPSIIQRAQLIATCHFLCLLHGNLSPQAAARWWSHTHDHLAGIIAAGYTNGLN